MKVNRMRKISTGLVLLAIVAVSCRKVVKQAVPGDGVSLSPKKTARMVAGLTPKGWKLYDKVMQFTPENLYEIIDGRAEFYIAYNVVGMIFASFEQKDDNTISINLSIYDMGTPLNAFGVFSGERSTGAPRLKLGRDGYLSGGNYYIWKGQYYVQVIASDTSDVLQKTSRALAENVTSRLYDSGESVWGLTMLPRENMVPQSIRYFLVDAMGLDFMLNTYTAEYHDGKIEYSVFLSRRESPGSAEKILTQFKKHEELYGKGVDLLKVDGIKLVLCDMGGIYDVGFQKGHLVAGVTSVKDKKMAIHEAIKFWRQLQPE